MMTEAEQKQYNRFIIAGYEPDLAAQLIKRGAWLGIRDPSDEDVAEINRYRAERDARADGDVAVAKPNS